MQEDTIISIRNLSKDFKLPHQKMNSVKNAFTNAFSLGNRTFEVQHALKDIDFEIKKGDFFGIVGRNGSGKSTLLKILAGIYQPTKGSISVKGKVVPFIELGVGFNPELTGRENVYLNGALLGFSEKEVDTKYKNIVEFAELERFMDQKLKNYSSGMQVRLAFSVATQLAESDILLIDEVLAVGDASFQKKCFEYFKKLREAKKTVVFVSHDMSAVEQYCTNGILVEQGAIVQKGKAAKVADEYKKLFINQYNTVTSKTKRPIIGNGNALFEDVSLKTIQKKSREYIILKVDIRFINDFEKPIFGFSIKPENLLQLAGTNTLVNDIEIGKQHANTKLTIECKIPNIFNNGIHYVDLNLAQDKTSVVADRWAEAASFVVKRKQTAPYPIVLDETIINFKEQE